MTFATYQGQVCANVKIRRSRGFTSDTYTVVLPAVAIPDHFRLSLGEPEDEPVVSESRIPVPGIGHKGTLVISEVLSGEEIKLEVPDLYVLRADVEERDNAGGVAFVRLTLVDWRYFARGVMPRWSFNRTTPSGSIARDSIHPDGTPYTLTEIAEIAVRAHVTTPTLAHTPDGWSGDRRDFQLAEWESASAALRKVVDHGGATDPCVRWGGQVALHKPGEGRLGYASDLNGPNDQDLPPWAFLDENPNDQGYTVDAIYPEPYLFVVGQPIVYTVAIDDWEPVFMLDGAVQPLNERTVRLLTQGKYGLDWLRRFVLLPSADQGRVDLPEDVTRLLAEQAFRMYRLPGAELVDPLTGRYSGEPGPNAHLLPLQNRAEVSVGNRAITVETYRWKTVRKRSVNLSGARLKELKLQEVLQNVQKRITQRGFRQLGVGPPANDNPDLDLSGAPRSNDPFGGTIRPHNVYDIGVTEGAVLDALDVNFLPPTLGERVPGDTNINRDELKRSMDVLRRAEFVRKTLGADVATQYENAYKAKLAAQDESGGARLAHFEMAKKLQAIEKEVFEHENFLSFDDLDDRLDVRRPIIQEILRDGGNAVDLKLQQDKVRRETGQRFEDHLDLAVALRNLPRTDAAKTIESRELGVIKVNELAGHVAQQGVSSPVLTSFVPCPVRVIFGATLRPRLDGEDVAPSTVARQFDALAAEQVGPKLRADLQRGKDDATQTRNSNTVPADSAGSHQVCLGGDNYIPKALSDRETFYLSVWKRLSQGVAEQVDLFSLSIPEAFAIYRRAIRVYEPWVQLEPIPPGATAEGQAQRDREREEALAAARAAEQDAALLTHRRSDDPEEIRRLVDEAAAARALAARLARPDLSPATGNKADLDENARKRAEAVFDVPDRVEGWERTLAGPWRVQCDGVVEAVTINMEFEKGAPCGYTTTVTLGSESSRDPSVGASRPRSRSAVDALKRNNKWYSVPND